MSRVDCVRIRQKKELLFWQICGRFDLICGWGAASLDLEDRAMKAKMAVSSVGAVVLVWGSALFATDRLVPGVYPTI
jgi:hypothetical protein